jgi:hypothetical protein
MNAARCAAIVVATVAVAAAAADVDHSYAAYGRVLRSAVVPPRVDYAALTRNRAALDAAVASVNGAGGAEERSWSRAERIAFWINAYNLFTLRAIVDHYPIRSHWFTLQPRNSIRQIDGVWTTLTWQAAGRTVTLDDIEHRILRPEFKDPRVHFAINCASISCPALQAEPYRAAALDAQLDTAARRYLASPEGLRADGNVLRVSSIFKWYGDDFVDRFASDALPGQDRVERAIRGVVIQFGPGAAAAAARDRAARVTFLDYNWSLNDVPPSS